jgi:thioredoxin 2
MKKNYLIAALCLAAYAAIVHFRGTGGTSDTEFSQDVVRAGDANFEEATSGSEWVLLDFWAPWCGPCRRLKPAINEVAETFKGRVRVVAVNVDQAPQSAQVFGVSSIPDLVLLRNGSVAARKVGGAPAEVLKKWIDDQLNGG